jgi:hypothetical protein
MFFGSSRTPVVLGKTQDENAAVEAAPASNVDMEVGNPSSWDEPPVAYSASHGQQLGSAHQGWLAGAQPFPYPDERRKAVQRRKELTTSLLVDIE